ncbi:MAG: hypothetical protein ACRDNZ_17865 [Streptosporangiaceae bacterium]
MTEIMISLGAVVLLILVIGFFAMRFLRGDDTDEFDEVNEPPARRGQSRRDPDEQDWHREGQVPPASRLRRGGPDEGQVSAPARGQRQPERGRSGRGDPLRDASRRDNPGRDAFRPARDRSSREYAASRSPRPDDPAMDDHGYGDRRFSFAPASAEDPGGAGGRRGAAAAPQGAWAPNDAESTQLMGPGSRVARGRPDQGQSPPDRRDASRRAAEGAAVRPAPSTGTGRPKRGGEMSGRDWDSLSDVDYWAELASDKPLTTTAQQAGPGRREEDLSAVLPRQDRRARPGLSDAPEPDNPATPFERAAGDVTAVLPSRRHTAVSPAAAPLPGSRPRAQGSHDEQGLLAGLSDRNAGRDGSTGRSARPGPDSHRQRDLSAARHGDPRERAVGVDADSGIAALARLSGPTNGASGPPVLDDDPLTSPSFPAIRSDDSRSYRSRRAEAAPGGHPSASRPSGRRAARQDTSLAGYSQQAGRSPDVASPRAHSAPASPVPPAAGYRDYADLPAPPEGNPYGSYVSSHGNPPAAARPDDVAYGGYQPSQEPQRYGQPPGHYLVPRPSAAPIHAAPIPVMPEPPPGDRGSSWHGAAGATIPAHVPSSGLYDQSTAPGYQGGGYQRGYQGGGHRQAGYPAPPSGGLYDQPPYLPADSPGPQQDQDGYGTPDSGYGTGAYGGYPSY